MTASAKEVIARALYELDPAEDQETDLDGRPVGKPYAITWDHIAEYEAPAVNSFRKDADTILAALDAAGYGVYRIKTIRTPFGRTVKLPVSDNLAAQEKQG